MLHTTFGKAKEQKAWKESYRKLVKALGGVEEYGLDTPIPLDKVLELLGLQDALWCLRITIEPCDKEVRLLACDYAEGKEGRVLSLFERNNPTDPRPRKAIEVSRLFAEGKATKEDLEIAHEAAMTAYAAYETAKAVYWAARAAYEAFDASDAAWAAYETANAARVAIIAATGVAGAAYGAESDWQKERFLQMLKGSGESIKT